MGNEIGRTNSAQHRWCLIYITHFVLNTLREQPSCGNLDIWVDNIKLDLREIRHEGGGRIEQCPNPVH
jgi:hypothetical protein